MSPSTEGLVEYTNFVRGRRLARDSAEDKQFRNERKQAEKSYEDRVRRNKEADNKEDEVFQKFERSFTQMDLGSQTSQASAAGSGPTEPPHQHPGSRVPSSDSARKRKASIPETPAGGLENIRAGESSASIAAPLPITPIAPRAGSTSMSPPPSKTPRSAMRFASPNLGRESRRRVDPPGPAEGLRHPGDFSPRK